MLRLFRVRDTTEEASMSNFDVWKPSSETGPEDEVDAELGGTPVPENEIGVSRSGGGRRGLLSCLGIVALVLAVLAGGIVWLFRDELLPPFGDDRACAGSDVRLPEVIRARGASIPAPASDIHYLTRNGVAEVTFLSSQLPDYLQRAGIVPTDQPLFDEKYGTKAVADDVIELPDGLCGPPLRGPVWIYYVPGTTDMSVEVEQSLEVQGSIRFPARAVVIYNLS
jgi:hypothetical protein